ncbi:hypothetical protein VTL71DRAFT_110 [Oculimacula yallundae]|uniref:Uncharacterized protein n=1 Tax=Oculimacula yallundae TaxID=86028 RepID=A0ABR4CZ22_9HELO
MHTQKGNYRESISTRLDHIDAPGLFQSHSSDQKISRTLYRGYECHQVVTLAQDISVRILPVSKKEKVHCEQRGSSYRTRPNFLQETLEDSIDTSPGSGTEARHFGFFSCRPGRASTGREREKGGQPAVFGMLGNAEGARAV